MKVRAIVQAALAAATLVGATAHPAAAHGAIREEVVYQNGDAGETGRIIYYCDQHVRFVGNTTTYTYEEVFFYGCA